MNIESIMSKKVLLILTLAPALCQMQNEPTSTVTILALDPFGRSIPVRVESFTLQGTAVELGSHFDGRAGTAIPFGTYEFVLRRIELK